MKSAKLLNLYQNYLHSQYQVAMLMKWAISYYEAGLEKYCWECLLEWAQAKEERTVIWRKVEDHYPRALCIKEGVMS